MSEDNDARLFKILSPDLISAYEKVRANNTRFVHYTTAEAALNIIRSSEMWMRKSTTMNDYMEVEHGAESLVAAYQSSGGKEFRDALDKVSPGLRERLEQLFDGWSPQFKSQTYLACLSEHDDREDSLGRLSMWRAYGCDTGVAIILKNGPLVSETDALNVYSAPVRYCGSDELEAELRCIAGRLIEDSEFVSSVEAECLVSHIFHFFRIAMLCTKHPGFKEEREWRIFHNPTYDQNERVRKSIVTIRGVPQPVVKVALKSYPDDGLVGMEISELLDRIVIGPTQYPDAIREAFVTELELAGVQNPMVTVSAIPLR